MPLWFTGGCFFAWISGRYMPLYPLPERILHKIRLLETGFYPAWDSAASCARPGRQRRI
jgi:hypothetical protein